ncbi:MAG: short-chain fatty acyl-CoA regulator family protein [Rhizomicrobium sp.]
MKLLPLAAVLGRACAWRLHNVFDSLRRIFRQWATLTDAEKALTVAHLAYQGAGVALEQAAQSGALIGANAAAAEALYDKAGTALDAADAADETANAADILSAVTDARNRDLVPQPAHQEIGACHDRNTHHPDP